MNPGQRGPHCFPAGSLTMNRSRSTILGARVSGLYKMDGARAVALTKYFGLSSETHWIISVFYLRAAWEDVRTKGRYIWVAPEGRNGEVALGGDRVGGEFISAVDGLMIEELR